MEKLITVLLLVLFGAVGSNAQTQYNQFNEVNHVVNQQVKYKLYPTFNMWTFLKLNTQNGEITQVQYSINGDEMEVYLGRPIALISDYVNGRYELYPTTNNWTFLLLDQIDGRVYHVQWSQESGDRFVYEIK